MSTNRRTLLVLVCVALLLNGCTKVTPPTPLTDIRTVLDKELFYLGMAEGVHLIVDPAADNKTYAVGTADAGGDHCSQRQGSRQALSTGTDGLPAVYRLR
jgi:putative hemolysin